MRYFILAMMLTGCVTVREVQMPCLGAAPTAPAIRYAESKPDKAAAVQDYIAELRAYVAQLKAQMAACK